MALDGRTKFYAPITTILSSVASDYELPREFALYQNYPNPFNPQTSIRYDLPKDAYVTLEIYDILGSLVNRLVETNVEAGKHTVIWNGLDNYGTQVSSGVYMYRISAGDYVKTHKMILMK